MKILVIDDDPLVRDILLEGFQGAGYSVQEARTGEEGLELFRGGQYDAVILDVGLPDLSGFEVARRIRQDGATTPLIMLTAWDTEGDVVRGLDLGADSYVTKPFSVPELLARVRALKRREGFTQPELLAVGELEVNQLTREVTYCGTAVRLTEMEFKLLTTLVKARGEFLTREELLRDIWGMEFDPETNVLDVHLFNLRKKIRAVGPPLIENVRGVGYRVASREQ